MKIEAAVPGSCGLPHRGRAVRESGSNVARAAPGCRWFERCRPAACTCPRPAAAASSPPPRSSSCRTALSPLSAARRATFSRHSPAFSPYPTYTHRSGERWEFGRGSVPNGIVHDEHPFVFQSSVVPTTVTRPVTRTAPSPVLEGPHQSASCQRANLVLHAPITPNDRPTATFVRLLSGVHR